MTAASPKLRAGLVVAMLLVASEAVADHVGQARRGPRERAVDALHGRGASLAPVVEIAADQGRPPVHCQQRTDCLVYNKITLTHVPPGFTGAATGDCEDGSITECEGTEREKEKSKGKRQFLRAHPPTRSAIAGTVRRVLVCVRGAPAV